MVLCFFPPLVSLLLFQWSLIIWKSCHRGEHLARIGIMRVCVFVHFEARTLATGGIVHALALGGGCWESCGQGVVFVVLQI